MKPFHVVPALVAVLLMAGLAMPAPPAHALAPWIVMGGIKLFDYLLQNGTKQERSEVGAMTVANLELDGQIVAGTPTAGLAELVVPRMDDHSVILLVDTQADVVPSICSDFTEIRVGCNRATDFTITPEMAAELAASRRGLTCQSQIDRPARQAERRPDPIRSAYDLMRSRHPSRPSPRPRDDGTEKDWIVPIDINELEFGQYIFQLDYFFKNGGKRDSFRVFIHLFVTSLEAIRDGVNSPAIQQELAMTGGMWTPIPALTPTRIPVTPEAAAANGMAQRAIAAGMPPDGTVMTTERELGQAITAPKPAPTATDYLARICEAIGYSGDPACAAPVFRTSLTDVPVVVCLRSPDQQVTVNGSMISPVCSGFVVVRTTQGQTLTVDVSGVRIYSGVAPPQGFGLWLNAH